MICLFDSGVDVVESGLFDVLGACLFFFVVLLLMLKFKTYLMPGATRIYTHPTSHIIPRPHLISLVSYPRENSRIRKNSAQTTAQEDKIG